MILAIGGGSSMDTAKGIGIIVENPEFEDVVSLEGVADAKKHAAFTIAVPATADTAAEVTIGYLVADPDKVRKFVCVDVSDIPDVAIADPDMMASMPAGLTAVSYTHLDVYKRQIQCLLCNAVAKQVQQLRNSWLKGSKSLPRIPL